MLLKCRLLGEGPGPSEIIVEITTWDGNEEVVVSSTQIRDNHLEIGSVIGVQEKFALVELPRETTSGKWRVWVPQSEILETA